MIAWMDITSPDLRQVFQEWCELRLGRRNPEIAEYNNFILGIPKENSISIVVPKVTADVYVRFIGNFGRILVPRIEEKMKLAEITPPTERVAIATPYYRAIRSGQPSCRRGDYVFDARKRRYEQLVLPFGDKGGRVCLVDSVFANLTN